MKDWQYLAIAISGIGLYALIKSLKAQEGESSPIVIPSPETRSWEDLQIVVTAEQAKIMKHYDIVMRSGMLNAVEPAVIASVIGAESGGDPSAMRWEGEKWGYAYGLMQLLLSTANQMGYTGDAKGLLDPGTNIEFGTRYLAWQRRRYKTLAEAISAYNLGTARWTKYGRLENATYVQRVLDRIPNYRSILAMVYPTYRQVVAWEDDITQPTEVNLPWWQLWG
jgi:soluble lytic murein transglycosylase-like protein